MILLCDKHRHLICSPYSIDNLHKAAKSLNIGRWWFHNDHYDIPKKMIEEVTKKCKVISSKDIVKIKQGRKL